MTQETERFAREPQEAMKEVFPDEDDLSVPSFPTEVLAQGSPSQAIMTPDSRAGCDSYDTSPSTCCCWITNYRSETAVNALTACTPTLVRNQSLILLIANHFVPRQQIHLRRLRSFCDPRTG